MSAIEPNLATAPLPRAITTRARRRSWSEPAVRGWILGAILILILAVRAMVTANQESRDTNWLIANGTAVDALVYVHEGAQLPGFSVPPDTELNFRFPWNGRGEMVTGKLPEQTKWIKTGHAVPLHIDPNDTNHWTARTIPLKWWTQLTTAMVLGSLAALLMAIAWLFRRQRLRTFQFGQRIDAIVLNTHTNPIAPKSNIVHCALPETSGSRSISVYLPQSVKVVTRGDTLPVLILPSRPDRALAAEAYL